MSAEQIAAGLTKAQRERLHKVCRTNGGGVYIRCKWRGGEVVPSDKPMCALFDKGLIQGKAGGYETVVHTRLGLEVRAILEKQHG